MQEPPTAVAPSGFAGLVRRAAAAGPDRPALLSPGQVTTWGELDAQVDGVARGLLALELEQSLGWPARVAIALPNVPEFATALFGALRAGLVAVPVNPSYTARELRYVLADSAAGVLIATPEVAEKVATVAGELADLRHSYTVGGYPVGGHTAGGPATFASLPLPGDPVDELSGGEDLAVLLYTSGTAGSPKGAMLSHRALIANHVQLAQIEPTVVGPDDTALLALPLFHAYGLNTGLGSVAYHGACAVLVDHFDPAHALELIARHQVSVVVGVPPMYVAWAVLAGQRPGIGEAMAPVRVAVCGAAPLEPATATRFTEATRHPVFVGYGLTETAPVLTSTLASPLPKARSIGRPVPGVRVRLIGADGDEVWHWPDPAAEVDDPRAGAAGAEDWRRRARPQLSWGYELEAPDSPGSDPGEIVVCGPNLFSGYWPDGRDGPDAQGWWATGDVAYADADGDLFLVDRLAELILVSGFNVYPREVELVLESHPGVAEAAVLGAPHPYTGQTVKAYVVRTAQTTAAGSGAVSAAELMRHCEQHLARFKSPTAVEFVAELPHSMTGKVRKAALRQGGGHD